ncbi:MAG TPA: type II toxin-antitoxin system HicA family toxin [Ignavibacteriaceae bacterium]|nr:type II toxin-antitoxin system HicA family toxin [Ignavibacteriaceae bacterium]
MAKLRVLNYKELTARLKKFGFVYYRSGKGSHELWVRNSDERVIPVPHYRGKNIKRGRVKLLYDI